MTLYSLLETAKPLLLSDNLSEFTHELNKIHDPNELFSRKLEEQPHWKEVVESTLNREGQERVWFHLERLNSSIDLPTDLTLFILDYGYKPTIIVTSFQKKK